VNLVTRKGSREEKYSDGLCMPAPSAHASAQTSFLTYVSWFHETMYVYHKAIMVMVLISLHHVALQPTLNTDANEKRVAQRYVFTVYLSNVLDLKHIDVTQMRRVAMCSVCQTRADSVNDNKLVNVYIV
jgi:hypothetical protein